MNRSWSWSLLVAALLALHAHAWLHATHGFDDLSQPNESSCVACQLGQHGGTLTSAANAQTWFLRPETPRASFDLLAVAKSASHPQPIRGPPTHFILS